MKREILKSRINICILALISVCYLLGSKSYGDDNVYQQTSGDKSPIITDVNGNVAVTYGVSQKKFNELVKSSGVSAKVIEFLLKTLEEKDVAIQERDGKIKELAKKYKEIKERIDNRPSDNEFIVEAKKKLQEGDLEGAESLLLKSYNRHMEDVKAASKKAAEDAFELANLKELKIEYHEAKKYYEEAVRLDPENSVYLNDLGVIL
jgi:tetratricopeptide (TPR) repeat protein